MRYVGDMRTTIELPETLFRRTKALAAQQGLPMREVIIRALEAELRAARRSRVRLRLPLLDSTRPGALKSLANAEIDDLLG